MSKVNTIWVLFSIANEYNQPENNLEIWWFNKPTFDVVAKAIYIKVDRKVGSPVVGKILKGKIVRWGGADYRLREIEEGEKIR